VSQSELFSFQHLTVIFFSAQSEAACEVLALPGNPAAVFHTTWNLGPLALRPSLSGGLPFSSNYCGPEKPVFLYENTKTAK
jgi:hypothetical protein